jgi:hypothetical protein
LLHDRNGVTGVRLVARLSWHGQQAARRGGRALQGWCSDPVHTASRRPLQPSVARDPRAPFVAIAIECKRMRSDKTPISSRAVQGQRAAPGGLDLARPEVARLSRSLGTHLRQAASSRGAPQVFEARRRLDVRALVRPQAARQDVPLHPDVRAEPTGVLAPRDELRQPLMNPLNDANADAPRDGRPELALRAEPERAILEGRDAGPGFPAAVPEDLSRMNFTTQAVTLPRVPLMETCA